MTYVLWFAVILAGLTLAFWGATYNPAKITTGAIYNGRVRFVADGDSLYLHGRKHQVRLWGVDAPERGRTGARAATQHLTTIAQNQIIRCQEIDTDRYGRSVARCFLSNGQELNRMMIESGHAREYRRFTRGFYGS